MYLSRQAKQFGTLTQRWMERVHPPFLPIEDHSSLSVNVGAMIQPPLVKMTVAADGFSA